MVTGINIHQLREKYLASSSLSFLSLNFAHAKLSPLSGSRR